MLVENDILITWGAVAKKYPKGEFVFREGEHAHFFYQIISGRVKVFNTNYDGKEFTQAEFVNGESFGEPPLFINETYPTTAMTVEDTVILKIKKEKFIELLDEYPSLQKKTIALFAKRIYNKSVTAREVINSTPEARILAFLHAYKKKHANENQEVKISYTRQEIANFTGLRVETVIRTLNKMKQKNKIKIVDRKVIF
ncbi:MAG: Crp/Fnr family transcriptional regulator [Bacteroidetes bacterium]|nr:Crp/Fnr family transcriptional regulator [Bacteroidota bacterium]